MTTGGLNINGGRSQDNLITFDGAVAVRTRSNGTSIGAVDLDSVQEVQIMTTDYGAEYGRVDRALAIASDGTSIYVVGFVQLGALPGQTSSGNDDAFVRKSVNAAGVSVVGSVIRAGCLGSRRGTDLPEDRFPKSCPFSIDQILDDTFFP